MVTGEFAVSAYLTNGVWCRQWRAQLVATRERHEDGWYTAMATISSSMRALALHACETGSYASLRLDDRPTRAGAKCGVRVAASVCRARSSRECARWTPRRCADGKRERRSTRASPRIAPWGGPLEMLRPEHHRIRMSQMPREWLQECVDDRQRLMVGTNPFSSRRHTAAHKPAACSW